MPKTDDHAVADPGRARHKPRGVWFPWAVFVVGAIPFVSWAVSGSSSDVQIAIGAVLVMLATAQLVQLYRGAWKKGGLP